MTRSFLLEDHVIRIAKLCLPYRCIKIYQYIRNMLVYKHIPDFIAVFLDLTNGEIQEHSGILNSPYKYRHIL